MWAFVFLDYDLEVTTLPPSHVLYVCIWWAEKRTNARDECLNCCSNLRIHADDLTMRALSIRQPYVEEILRGTKTSEIRTWETRIIGEKFYIYAAQQPGEGADVPKRFARLGAKPGELPVGLLVGTARITHVTESNGMFHWHLDRVQRLKRPKRPKNRPQPAWFNPY